MFTKIIVVILASLLYPFGFRPYNVIGRFKIDNMPTSTPVTIYTVILPQDAELSVKTEMMRKQIPAVEVFEEFFTFDNLQRTTMRDYYLTKLIDE